MFAFHYHRINENQHFLTTIIHFGNLELKGVGKTNVVIVLLTNLCYVTFLRHNSHQKKFQVQKMSNNFFVGWKEW